ncbi:MAG: DUF58 domain-containing protein [Deltaproteobacteria bacterium]|nr:DUF58 domain-containing protein [Deltaproteobacteria bacterium]
MFKGIPYYLLKWTSSARHFLVRRFTYAGMLLLVCLIISALLGLDTYKTTAYEIFTFLLALFLASFSSLLLPGAKLSLSRKLPKLCTAGERVSYKISIKNLTDKHYRALSVIESLPDPRPNPDELAEEFKRRSAPGKMKRLFTKKGYLGAWQRQIRKKLMANVESAYSIDIASSEKKDLSLTLLPMRRGFIRFKTLTLSQPDPLGIMKNLKDHHLEESLLVLPKRYSLPPISLPAKRRYHQGGISLASKVGDSDEFISLRDYRPGDPLRTIHWKSWAKTGKPVVKEYEDEHFSRHALFLDTFGDESISDLFEEAVSVAASFASSLEKGESLLDLIFVGDEAFCFTSGRHTGSRGKMLEILAAVDLCRDKDFSTLANAALQRAALLTSAIGIFLSWDESRQSFIKKMMSHNIPLMIFIITEEGESIDPGIMKGNPESFHLLEKGKIAEALARL